jgi:uncharacterized protein (DUF952 family)
LLCAWAGIIAPRANLRKRWGAPKYHLRMRWLYHLISGDAPLGDPYAPPSLAKEGFIHCSYRDAVAESARLYFPAGADLRVLQIDPTRVAAPIEEAATPRGPMPHIHGALPRHAIVATLTLDALAGAPDRR